MNMPTYISSVIIVFLIQFTGCYCDKNVKCERPTVSKLSTELTEIISEDYGCPREFDPETFTECCPNGGCCKPTLLSMAPSNNDMLMIVAILVMTSCFLLTIMVVVCCFWSKCPLYNTCRANYNTSNVIVYSLGKEDPALLMPAEVNKGSQYNPCTIKVKKMQEV